MKNLMHKGWMFDRHINLGYVMTALTLVISAIWWLVNIEKRIAVLEVELKAFYEAQVQLEGRQDSEVDKLYSQIDHLTSDK